MFKKSMICILVLSGIHMHAAEDIVVKAEKEYREICQNTIFHFTNPAKSADCLSKYRVWNKLIACEDASNAFQRCLNSYSTDDTEGWKKGCAPQQLAATEACTKASRSVPPYTESFEGDNS